MNTMVLNGLLKNTARGSDKYLMGLSYLVLFVSLSISTVAAYYSIAGLTAIFAAAVIPVVIMSIALEIAKVTTTVWLHKYWSQCRLLMKLYLIPAVLLLMFITSLGIFGFLSKAHLDQGVPSADVAAKIALLDEKIKTERDTIEVSKQALSQLNATVDQTIARSTSEQGAGRAVQLRKSQAKERASLQNDIAKAQDRIAALNDERAPIASTLRKVEAEVGPIKYLAAVIYGDNPDGNLLERAVRWVIILLVMVFDPLAIMMVLASTESMKWERERRKAVDNQPEISDDVQYETGDTEDSSEDCPNHDCDVVDNIVDARLDREGPPTAFFEEVDITVVDDDDDEEEEHHNYKKASKIWKMINTHTTLKEQRKMFQRGQIEKLPWTEPEFIARVESGEFD
jgi:hypothetical protein